MLPSKTVCYETLTMVGQRERFRAHMQDPLEMLLRIDDEPVMEFTPEFLASFSLAKKPEIHNMGDVKFRAGGHGMRRLSLNLEWNWDYSPPKK
jgi:hypothetical protein